MKNKERERGMFCTLFGDTPRNAIIEWFLECEYADTSLSLIAEDLMLSKATVYAEAKKLLTEEIILPTRKVGNTQLYALNPDNKQAQFLLRVFDELVESIVESYAVVAEVN